MKKGMKLALQIIGILLVVALIGGGIYWLVTHNNSALAVNNGFAGGRHGGGGFEGMRPNGDFGGMRPGGDFDSHGGRNGVNLGSGLLGVGRILLEVGVVTGLVLLVQWLIRRVRKPKASAATPFEVVEPMVETLSEAPVEPQDVQPPTEETK